MVRIFAAALFLSVASAQVQITPLFDLPGETSDPVLSPDGKTLAFEWWKPDYSFGIYIRPFAGGEVRLLAGKNDKVPSASDPRWSPDGKRVALTRFYSHYDTHLVVREIATGAEHDFGNVCGYASTGVWSPDGKFLVAEVYKSEGTLACRPALFSLATGARAAFLAPNGATPSFSPDGHSVAYGDGRSLMLLRLNADRQPAGPPSVLVRELREVGVVGWKPDGKQIVYGVALDAPTLRRIAIAPGSLPQNIDTGDLALSITQFLPDGSALATETPQNSALWRADLRSTPPKLQKVPDLECPPGILGCSPDGRRRAFISTKTGFFKIAVSNADGTGERVLVRSLPEPDAGPNPFPNVIGWSPNGKWVAFAVLPAQGNTDFRSYLYVVPSSGGTPQRLGKEAYALDFPIWSPDSNSLYAVQGWPIDNQGQQRPSNIVRVDVADGRITTLGPGGIWLRLSPDGKYLYFSEGTGRSLWRMPAAGGSPQRLLSGNFSFPGPLAGSRFVYLLRDQEIIRFDPNSGQSATILNLDFRLRIAALSADENFLYLGQQDDSKRRAVLVRGLK